MEINWRIKSGRFLKKTVDTLKNDRFLNTEPSQYIFRSFVKIESSIPWVHDETGFNQRFSPILKTMIEKINYGML